MGWLIGMDEAGYGPNLGPLVVAATSWSVPGNPRKFDLRKALDSVICEINATDDDRLCIADSKQVYSPAKGIEQLELGVMAMLQQVNLRPASLLELWEQVSSPNASRPKDEPWYEKAAIPIPYVARQDQIDKAGGEIRRAMKSARVKLANVRFDLMLGERFNRLVRAADSKGICLSQTSMQLLRQVWNPSDPQKTHVIADKHGGRNRYDELLDEILDGEMIFRVLESRERSEYKVAEASLIFRTKAECHLPVALASMVAKYTRELAMIAFNDYWIHHHPEELKPTKGYPVDARRFRLDIAETQKRLGITDEVLWRER